MTGMKLLSSLPFDQIGHPPSGPQASAITQSFGACFQALAHLLQLLRVQARFAARASSLFESVGSVVQPGMMPTADRLAMDLEFARHLGLAQALVEELGGFEPPPLQLTKVAFNAFGITHAQRLSRESTDVTIFYDIQ